MTSERTKAMDDLIAQDADLIDKLRDEDSYYRIQEKHWCIDSEELERQRLAAADRIEHLEQALREIIDFGDGDTGYGNSCAKIARAALGATMTKQLTPLRRKDQATGYQAAVRDIVAWLRKDDFILTADELEKKFGKANVAD